MKLYDKLTYELLMGLKVDLAKTIELKVDTGELDKRNELIFRDATIEEQLEQLKKLEFSQLLSKRGSTYKQLNDEANVSLMYKQLCDVFTLHKTQHTLVESLFKHHVSTIDSLIWYIANVVGHEEVGEETWK